MTDVGLTRSAARVPPRPSRSLVLTFSILLVGTVAVWSPLVNDRLTRVNYEGSGQSEIDARREAVRQAPENPGVLLELAYAYQQAGRYDNALRAYEAVLELVPSETAALYNQAVILLKLGEVFAAEDALRATLEVNPTHALAAGTLGSHLLEAGEYEEVLDVVLPAAERSAGAADLHYLAGVARENLGETELAVESYERALQYHPDLREARAALERLGARP